MNIRQGWVQIHFNKYKYKYKYFQIFLTNTNTNTNTLSWKITNTNTNTNILLQIQIQIHPKNRVSKNIFCSPSRLNAYERKTLKCSPKFILDKEKKK